MDLVEIVDDETATVWRFDPRFLLSNWTCLWGRGCLGVLDVPAPELMQGCCSYGADLDVGDEAMTIAALAATLDPDRFQHHAEAASGGAVVDGDRLATRVVDGACIFLNRPGFAGGAGCALHIAAIDAGESPLDWKPSVCWQLPVRIDWEPDGHGGEIANVRAWRRDDWGAEGDDMAWCCTEGSLAYVGDDAVVDALETELRALVGDGIYDRLRAALRQASPTP